MKLKRIVVVVELGIIGWRYEWELQWHPFKTFCLKYFNMVQNMIRKRLANIEKSPNKGMASLVAGIVSARTCENTVRDSRIVTPEINIQVDYYQMVAVW